MCGPGRCLTSYVINDAVALDAGALGFYDTVGTLSRVRDVVLSHSHIDHIASLPIFVDHTFEPDRAGPTVHGSEHVLDALRRHIFNDCIWPDFTRFSTSQGPALRYAALETGMTLEVAGVRITPIPVEHAVPTHGFLVEDDDSGVLFVSDSGPTTEIWQHANRAPRLDAVFLEASFPDGMEALAQTSGHLTPALFAAELHKLQRRARIIAVHVKPRYRDEIARQLAALGRDDVEVGEAGREYVF
jgi:cAMP phosphodiesterase